jgi:hypothetical protein
VTIFGAPPKAAVLESLAAAGVSRAVFFVPSAGPDVVLPLLDQYALLL